MSKGTRKTGMLPSNGKAETGKTNNLADGTENSDGKILTTSTGVKVNHTDDSLKAGKRGPTIMEDFHLREKITHFDHERIPERVVHARGSAAHGYFQVYEPLTELTKAKIFEDPSKKTPVFVRFSTVVGFRGSADTVRDVRGFSTKFYTEDGNWDLVGNNMPVFFIQDAIKFPDLVHAIKPEPHNEVPQASAAHDNFWDFISLMPESMHMIMWVLSDRAYMVANIDRDLANQIAMRIGVLEPSDEAMIKEVAKDALPKASAKRSVAKSPSLSQENLKGNSIQGRKVAILIDEGFDDKAVMRVKEMLMENNAMVEIVSKYQGNVKSMSGLEIESDQSHLTTSSIMYDAIFIPGGKNVELMKKQGDVIHFINEAYKHCKPIAATGEAVDLFMHSGIEGAEFVSDNKNVKDHMGVVTSRNADKLDEVSEKFRTAIIAHRHWAREHFKEAVPA